jgi:hypothetical protein
LSHVAHLVATQILVDFADEGFGRIGRKRQEKTLKTAGGERRSLPSPPRMNRSWRRTV